MPSLTLIAPLNSVMQRPAARLHVGVDQTLVLTVRERDQTTAVNVASWTATLRVRTTQASASDLFTAAGSVVGDGSAGQLSFDITAENIASAARLYVQLELTDDGGDAAGRVLFEIVAERGLD
jgi:hypothetical protein